MKFSEISKYLILLYSNIDIAIITDDFNNDIFDEQLNLMSCRESKNLGNDKNNPNKINDIKNT